MLPTAVYDAQGNEYEVEADFRTVLKCLRVMSDPDVRDYDAVYLLMLWFYKGTFVPNGVELFAQFISDDESSGESPKMDFEQDADVIYASFLSEYGIDLLETPMHWRRFCVLLNGLSEKSALHARIALREMDTSKLKGKDRARAERAKSRVALRERVSEAEEAIREELQQALEEGRDPAPILEKLRNMGGE